MNKVVILNGWSDLNSGDSAIIISMIKRIKEEVRDCEITIISELNEKNKFYKNSIDYIKKTHKDKKVSLVGSIFYKSYDKNMFKKVHEVLSIIYHEFLLILPKKILLKIVNNNEYYSTLINGDIILSKGGHFLFDRGGIHGLIHIVKCTYAMRFLRKIDKKYYIISQSIGPFTKKGVLSKVTWILCENVLKCADKISVREEKTLEELNKLGYKENNINVTSDYAFCMEYYDYENPKYINIINKYTKNKYVVFTIRQHKFKKITKEIYLKTILELGKYIKNKYGYNLLLVPHVCGPNSFEDDRIIVEEFKEKYDKKNIFLVVNDVLPPQILKKLYSKSELLIGTRFHSVIYALSENVPVLAISYSGYKAHIMNQFDLIEYMYDIEFISNNNIDEIKCKIDSIFSNRREIVKNISKSNKNVLDNIKNDCAFLTAINLIKRS